MHLKELVLRRKESWEDKARPLVGYLRVESNDGNEVKINVGEAAAQKIVALCADGIIEASREVALMLKDDVMKYKALPHDKAG
jgi:hypothetical protein